MWKKWQDHDSFHLKQFDRGFELCGSCLSMVVEGPWEPIYRVVKAKPTQVRGVMAHLIKGPYIMFLNPMMEEPGWREYLM